MKHSLIVVLCGLYLVAGCASESVQSDSTNSLPPLDLSATATYVYSFALEEEQTFQDYTVRLYRRMNSEGFFEIWKNDRLLYTQDGPFLFRVGSADWSEEPNPLTAMGNDITGNGMPNLVVAEWTGGAHCCDRYYVFEIGEAFSHLGTTRASHRCGLETDDVSVWKSDFVDLDGDSNLEFVTKDWAFASWRISFAGSPAPTVILRFRDGAYRLADDLMRQPAPTSEELTAHAMQVRNLSSWADSQPPVEIWRYMLALMCSGHADLAWQFFKRAWPAEVSGQKEFLDGFCCRLSKSWYWPEVQRLSSVVPMCGNINAGN